MAKNTFYVSIGAKTGSKAKSVQDCIDWLKDYQKQLNQKTKLFVDRLADAGINVANLNPGYYAAHYVIDKKDESTGDEIVVIVYGQDTDKIVSTWYHNGEEVSAEISPILMAEFGAGWLAEVPQYPVTGNKPSGVGRGSHSKYGRGYQDDWWWTKVVDHHPISNERATQHKAEMTPTHPMYEAVSYMFHEGNRIAKEVFG